MPDLSLIRTRFCPEGIFGELHNPLEDVHYYTLEHSYGNQPKLPNGQYVCIRGQHRLHGMTEDFTTFEVTQVPGHQGILFHWGNYNKDSEGCVLLGSGTQEKMITGSRLAFDAFMASLKDLDQFTLIVS